MLYTYHETNTSFGQSHDSWLEKLRLTWLSISVVLLPAHGEYLRSKVDVCNSQGDTNREPPKGDETFHHERTAAEFQIHKTGFTRAQKITIASLELH